jgi:hypothetical protein
MPDGRLDSTFGSGGIAVVTFDDPEVWATGAALASDGRVVIVGNHSHAGTVDIGLARVLAPSPTSVDRPPGGTPIDLLTPLPNPSSGTATVRYAVPYDTPVRLGVIDALGREVLVILDARRTAGTHVVQFDVSALAAGTYRLVLRAGPGLEVTPFTVAR